MRNFANLLRLNNSHLFETRRDLSNIPANFYSLLLSLWNRKSLNSWLKQKLKTNMQTITLEDKAPTYLTTLLSPFVWLFFSQNELYIYMFFPLNFHYYLTLIWLRIRHHGITVAARCHGLASRHKVAAQCCSPGSRRHGPMSRPDVTAQCNGLAVRKLDQNSGFYCEQWQIYRAELLPRVCAIEQLLELDVSALGFPLPFFGGLGVLCCHRWSRCVGALSSWRPPRCPAMPSPGSGSLKKEL